MACPGLLTVADIKGDVGATRGLVMGKLQPDFSQ
jgi:hypothetical protein